MKDQQLIQMITDTIVNKMAELRLTRCVNLRHSDYEEIAEVVIDKIDVYRADKLRENMKDEAIHYDG